MTMAGKDGQSKENWNFGQKPLKKVMHYNED